MWKILLIVLFAHVVAIQCYKKGTVGPRPRPMKNFDPHKVTGRWYVQARFISCHFQGARGFTDSLIDVKLVEKEYFDVTNIHRVGPVCSTVADKRYFNPGNGNCAVHYVKDTIGNMYSGERIITATDYKRLLIVWSCLKYSQENPKLCDDPALSIYTRERMPNRHTKNVIDEILKVQFQLVMADLDLMSHDSPC